jgi:prolyl-tRNA editing enzyme YbaK/EbsC (Cys-tRNA(Pro) deacylase)
MSNLDKKSVLKVVNELNKLNHSSSVIELQDTARSALDASLALNVPVGAIVKTLIFLIQSRESETPVITLISGDRLCNTKILAQLLNVEGKVIRPDADTVKSITGYSIGGVSPIGLPKELNIIADSSLKRFKKIWSAAGHPYCVFGSTFDELISLTGAQISEIISISDNRSK